MLITISPNNHTPVTPTFPGNSPLVVDGNPLEPASWVFGAVILNILPIGLRVCHHRILITVVSGDLTQMQFKVLPRKIEEAELQRLEAYSDGPRVQELLPRGINKKYFRPGALEYLPIALAGCDLDANSDDEGYGDEYGPGSNRGGGDSQFGGQSGDGRDDVNVNGGGEDGGGDGGDDRRRGASQNDRDDGWGGHEGTGEGVSVDGVRSYGSWGYHRSDEGEGDAESDVEGNPVPTLHAINQLIHSVLDGECAYFDPLQLARDRASISKKAARLIEAVDTAAAKMNELHDQLHKRRTLNWVK